MDSRSILKLQGRIKAPLGRGKGLIDTQKHKLVIADQLLQTYRMNLLSGAAILQSKHLRFGKEVSLGVSCTAKNLTQLIQEAFRGLSITCTQ